MQGTSRLPYRVLLSDLDGSDISAEMPYLFHKAGCLVDVYCSSSSWLRKNSYVHTWHRIESLDPKEYAQGLVALLKHEQYDWVVLTNDYALRAVNDTVTDERMALSILPIAQSKDRALIGSKAALSEFSTRNSIQTPPYVIYRSDSDIEKALREIDFPLLLKVDRSGGGRGLHLCKNEEELRLKSNLLTDEERSDLVIQQYIPGTNVASEALYKNGTLLAYTYATIHKNAIDEFGVSISRTYMPAPHMKALLEQIGNAFSLDGFCSYTFMLDESTSTYYLVEADLRTHSWFLLSNQAGVDFSKAIREYLSHTDTPSCLSTPEGTSPILVRHFFREMRWSIAHVDLLEIGRWVLNRDGRWNSIPFHDMRMLFAYVVMYLKKILERT
jgi:hypothetical protein